MNSLKNRRNDVRVNMSVPIRWKILNSEEIQLVKKGLDQTLLKKSNLTTPIDEVLEQVAPDSEEELLYRSLKYIDNKLDFLIEQVLAESTDDFPHSDEIIEMSASGVKFITNSPLATDTYLKINLIMPGTFQYRIDCIAKVVRTEEKNNKFLIAVNIISIDKVARESMIKVIFQKQRKDIRIKKMNQEEIDAD